MSRITVGQENSRPIELYYEDLGSGSPVVLIHGWPLSGASWEKQVSALLAAGHRVVTYDRRGFGQSGKPSVGYDYDTLAEDLHRIVTKLDLRDVALVGFSMGGGEVARYIGRYGTERVRKAVFVSSITPCLLGAPDNPTGLPRTVFDEIRKSVLADRPGFLAGFLSDFYNVDVLGGTLASPQAVQYAWNVAVAASGKATRDCVLAWQEDFREDLARIDVPTLVVHGDADRILPMAATALPLAKLVPGSRLVVVEGGPHGIGWTHAEQVNAALIAFLGEEVAATAVESGGAFLV